MNEVMQFKIYNNKYNKNCYISEVVEYASILSKNLSNHFIEIIESKTN